MSLPIGHSPRLLKRKFENWHYLILLTLTDPRRGVLALTLTLTLTDQRGREFFFKLAQTRILTLALSLTDPLGGEFFF